MRSPNFWQALGSLVLLGAVLWSIQPAKATPEPFISYHCTTMKPWRRVAGRSNVRLIWGGYRWHIAYTGYCWSA